MTATILTPSGRRVSTKADAAWRRLETAAILNRPYGLWPWCTASRFWQLGAWPQILNGPERASELSIGSVHWYPPFDRRQWVDDFFEKYGIPMTRDNL